MNRKYLIVGIIIIVLIALAVFINKPEEFVNPNISNEGNYVDKQIGISFEFPTNMEYVVQEPPVATVGSGDLIKALILIPESDFESLKESTDGTEGPPTINILAFKNTSGLSASEWFQAAGAESVQEIEIGGVPAIEFFSDGLYQSRNVVVTQNGLLYFISASYIDSDSDIYKDFSSMLETMSFSGQAIISGGVTSVSKADGIKIIIMTELGSEELIEIPPGGLEQCQAASRLIDADEVRKGNTIQAQGSRNVSGVIVPCNSEDHFFTILNAELPEEPPTSEQG